MPTLIRPKEPTRLRWTRDEYHRMTAMGLFEGRRVELIRGEIVAMAAQLTPHRVGVIIADRVIRKAFGEGWVICVQLPIELEDSEPEPDVAVVAGDPLDQLVEHPRKPALVVEVADSTLEYDRSVKASLYASAGLADYWILNLVDGQLEVLRDPEAIRETYGSVEIFRPGDSVRALACQTVSIAVSDLLPPQLLDAVAKN